MNKYNLRENVDVKRAIDNGYVYWEDMIAIAQDIINELLKKNADLRQVYEDSKVLKMRGAMKKLMNIVDRGDPLVASQFYQDFKQILEEKT